MEMLSMPCPTIDNIPVVFVSYTNEYITMWWRIGTPTTIQNRHHCWGFVQVQLLKKTKIWNRITLTNDFKWRRFAQSPVVSPGEVESDDTERESHQMRNSFTIRWTVSTVSHLLTIPEAKLSLYKNLCSLSLYSAKRLAVAMALIGEAGGIYF